MQLRIVVPACFCGFIRNWKYLSVIQGCSGDCVSAPTPFPHIVPTWCTWPFFAIAQLSTCPCRRFVLEIVRWDTARFTPSALLRNHPQSLESVAILDGNSRTVPDRSVSVTQKRHEACLLWNDRFETIESILVLFPHCAFFNQTYMNTFFMYFIYLSIYFQKAKAQDSSGGSFC